MGSPGDAQIKVWKDVAAQYEALHPGWTVDLNFMNDDQYETVGLPNLLSGRKAPDLYFEWAGHRLATRVANGFAADLTPYVDGALKGIWNPGLFDQTRVNGKVSMIPHMADVTTLIWYNKDLYTKAQVNPPASLNDLISSCAAFSGQGVSTIALGNKDLWPAGNFFAMIASRVVGPDVYDATMAGKSSFDSPAWVKAMEQVKAFADKGCVNSSAAAIDDNAGAQLFFQGKAAVHPIGSWLVSWAVTEAPALNFDFVNIPPVDGGAGDQHSVMGVLTGYVVNAKSPRQKEAVDFMALLESQKNVDAFIKAEAVPLALVAAKNTTIDPRTARLGELLASTTTIVSPPDTGYDVERANALYQAISSVLGGQASPADAVKTLADQTK
jgi:raffinose/stachyose/melibiose transport system substrate-binding protein